MGQRMCRHGACGRPAKARDGWCKTHWLNLQKHGDPDGPPPVSDLPGERWLPVPVTGCGDLYEVSDQGRIRSLDRWIYVPGWFPYLKRGKLLAASPSNNGYMKVTIFSFSDGTRKQITPAVHRLVLEAFVGQCPAGQEGRHGRGGKQDNRLANLSYGTKSENAQDKRRDGTYVEGSASANAKLTEDVVRECRRRYAAGDGTTVSLAAEFGVSQLGMWKAINRQTWRHVA